MALLEVKGIKKSFGRTEVLKGIDFSVEKGEVLSVIGSSGSGKTTLLRCINFLEFAEEGTVSVNGEVIYNGITDKKIKDKDLRKKRLHFGLVFQSFNLFPQYNVLQNIMLAPGLMKMGTKDELKTRAFEMIEKVGLADKAENYPCELSGGQQQRVAIARALANKPHVLLLDEPLGALDLKLRKDMQKELKAIQKRLGITFIYVTHDQEEALSMSDRVVVMDKGKIQQIGTPEEIYNEPVNAFVADFIGESNIVDAVMVKDYLVRFHGVTFDCLDKGFAPNELTEAVVRPEDIKICNVGRKDSLTGVITDVIFKGTFFETFVDVNGFIWLIQTTDYHKVGETVGMYIEADAIHVMKRSEYSGEFGDYSSFSDEFDHINDADYDWEAENEQ